MIIGNNILQFRAPASSALEMLSETDLQFIWHERLLRDKIIMTDTGDTLKIIFPGRWNRGPGPDFIGARLFLGNKEILGDVEIHKMPEEWYKHLHHIDSAYNNVRLHFSLSSLNPERIRTAAGKLVPQIFPENLFTQEQLKVISDYRSGSSCLTPYWQNTECSNDFRPAVPAKLKSYLTSLGMERIINKTARFRKRISEVGYEQVVYEGLFESAGYNVNQHQFLFLAASMDMKRMREILQQIQDIDRAVTVESLLLGAARLLPNQSAKTPDLDLEGSIHARELEMKWRKIRHLVEHSLSDTGTIRRFGQMPPSSPSRMLGGIAHFISEYYDKNLFDLFYSRFRDFGDELIGFSQSVASILNGSAIRFWSCRAGFTEPRDAKRKMVFGRDKVNRFIGNILIPVFLHHVRSKHERKSVSKLYEYAGELSGSENRYTRFIYNQLPTEVRKDLHLSFIIEQGMIAHYTKNCSESRCFDCPLRDK